MHLAQACRHFLMVRMFEFSVCTSLCLLFEPLSAVAHYQPWRCFFAGLYGLLCAVSLAYFCIALSPNSRLGVAAFSDAS
jgi:CHASE1-domain containing sensor protein